MARMNIDDLSAELTKEFSAKELSFPEIEKALPPKLAYRFQKWLKSLLYKKPAEFVPQVEKSIKNAFEEMVLQKTLKKNEAMVSIYDSGMVKMDFGSDVSPKLKAAAMEWAKKRGLKASEATMVKSKDSNSRVVFGDVSGNCMKRLKFS